MPEQTSLLPQETVQLVVDGRVYLGWTDIEIRRALDSLVGSFRLSLTSRESTGAERWPLRAGASCELRVSGETLITGWIDQLQPQYDGYFYGISISGRDRAADLVDASAVHSPGSWRNVKLEVIARALLAPFGIALDVAADTGAPVTKFALQQGASVWSEIERLCRYRGLLAYSLPDGTVRIAVPSNGSPIAALLEGRNILRGSADFDVTERFSEIIVKGQASGSDTRNGRAITSPSARATDPAITRHRPLIVIGEEQSDAASLKKRAEWEAQVRAARSQPASVTVQGWRTLSGKLWDIDTIVALDAPSLFIRSDMLVKAVTFTLGSAEGTLTQLELEHPDAWKLLPVSEAADASQIGEA